MITSPSLLSLPLSSSSSLWSFDDMRHLVQNSSRVKLNARHLVKFWTTGFDLDYKEGIQQWKKMKYFPLGVAPPPPLLDIFVKWKSIKGGLTIKVADQHCSPGPLAIWHNLDDYSKAVTAVFFIQLCNTIFRTRQNFCRNRLPRCIRFVLAGYFCWL